MDSGRANKKVCYVGWSLMRRLHEKYLGCESFCISRYHFIGLFRSMDIPCVLAGFRASLPPRSAAI